MRTTRRSRRKHLASMILLAAALAGCTGGDKDTAAVDAETANDAGGGFPRDSGRGG